MDRGLSVETDDNSARSDSDAAPAASGSNGSEGASAMAEPRHDAEAPRDDEGRPEPDKGSSSGASDVDAPRDEPHDETSTEAAVEAAAGDSSDDEDEPSSSGDELSSSGDELSSSGDEPSSSGDEPSSSGQMAGEGGEATAGEGKKKRRRRRKKKGAGESGEKAADRAEAGGEGPDDGERRSAAERPRKKPQKPLERPAFNVGDEVFGKVSRHTRFAIWVDVAGGKAQGLFDREDLIQVPPRPGEQIIAKVKSFSTRGGMLVLGRELWDPAQSRAEVRAALENNQQLTCWVTGVIKGGLEVDYKGLRGFAPASHVELRPAADLSPFLGEKLPFAVTQYARKGRDVVFSRKDQLEVAAKEKRDVELAKIEADMVVRGVVRTVLHWGAFVSLPDHGDIEGVIHMSEASHDRGARPNDVFKAGEEIQVKVLRIDDKGKMWLSHKATLDDPWMRAVETYSRGSYHKGKVVRLTDFGAFVQLEPGIDGLCHVSDLAFTPVAHPKDVVNEGDEIEVVVANIDPKARKIGLHPAPPEAERGTAPVRVALYQMVNVVVVQIRESGLGVRIVGATGRHARGFVPAGQTGTPRGTDLRKTFPLGHKLEAKVIDLDPRRGEARLSIRALKDDAEKQAYRDYRKKVAREATFGTFGDLLKGKL
jgi:small subunit ribosomal protein S1